MRLVPVVPLLAPLAPREEELLRWVLQGYRPREVAVKMGVRTTTVEKYSQSIDRKIPGNRPRAQRWALWAAGCPIEYLSIPRQADPQ